MAQTTTKITASKGTINMLDVAKGALVAAIAAVLAFLSPLLEAGTFEINWKRVGIVAASAFVGYLIKNLFTPPQIVINNPPTEHLEAVKKGEATVEVQPK